MLVIEAPSRRTCTLEVTPLIAWDIEVAVPLLEEVAMKAQTLDYAAVQKIRHLIMVLFGTSFGALGDLACTALICNFLPAVTWQCYFAILCVFACVVTAGRKLQISAVQARSPKAPKDVPKSTIIK